MPITRSMLAPSKPGELNDLARTFAQTRAITPPSTAAPCHTAQQHTPQRYTPSRSRSNPPNRPKTSQNVPIPVTQHATPPIPVNSSLQNVTDCYNSCVHSPCPQNEKKGPAPSARPNSFN